MIKVEWVYTRWNVKGYVLAYNELIDASYTCLLISRRVTSGPGVQHGAITF
jgi:hypothetical protein